jgi:mRNA-degrading endonuclease RelE of RelBE toxin-antitoxin system
MAKYKLVYAPSARKDMSKLPRKIADAVASFCEGPLVENHQRVGKPLLRNYEGLYSAKRGSYRVIYRIENEKVIVTVAYVEHRADVYRPSR